MTNRKSPGFVRRFLTAFGGILNRALLGKSSHASLSRFTGSPEYWDRGIAAQLGWPQKQPPRSDPDTVLGPTKLEYELVHGWTPRQLDDYLARNPGYRSAYEAELQKRLDTTALEGTRSLTGPI